jgi:hypothetical protein
MKRILPAMLFALLLLAGWAQAKAPNPYELIQEQAQAEDVMRSVQATMQQQFGLRLIKPVQIHLVEPAEMDKLLGDSPYKGNEIGLYTGVRGGKHQVYVMKGWARDYAAGITAHELTHAWQEENVPAHQEQAVKEGFAMWVEYKFYDVTGAYAYADKMRDTADPVYGVGFFAIMDAERAIGQAKVADTMRRAVAIKDLPKK